MKRLLSIFSFSTLAERPRLSRAVLLGAGILLALELAVGWGLRTGRLADGRALEQLVEGQRRTLRESRAPVWLLGNSALAYGVDPDRLAAELGRGVASLRHGSCTAAGSASMLEHYLDEAGFRPDLVALCVTKDDFNLRGYRASMSGVYRWYGRWYDLSLDRISRVSAARESLKDKARAWRKGGGGSAASAPADAGETREEGAGGTTVFEGTIDEREARWLEQLAWSFSPDWSGLDRIAARARREGFRPVLVWLPVTPEYRRFHDERYPEQTHADLQRRAAERGRALGFEVVDLTESLAAPGLFRDPYHLNDAGRAEATPALAGRLRALLPATTGEAAAGQPRAASISR